MHDHECRYCGDRFICDESADECFQTYIVCQECFWTHDFRHFLLVCFLAALALCATVYLFREMKKPAFAAPVSGVLETEEITTGEIYYENEKGTTRAE